VEDVVNSVYRIIVLSCVFLSGIASATITPSSGQAIKVVVGESAQYLTLNDAINGISYNKYSDFGVHTPTVISNTTKFDGDTLVEAAKLIIIESNQVNITSKIEIVGETADLLIVNSSGAVYVVNGMFRNISRLTLATAILGNRESIQSLLISPASSSALFVNGVDAAGVAEVNFVTSNLSFNGNIITNKKASYLADGSYEFNDIGNLVVGSGGVNLFYGVDVEYSSYEILPKLYAVPTLTLGGNIQSASTKVVSIAPIIHIGTINTTSDLLSTTQAQGNLIAVEEGISFYLPKTDKTILLNGNLYSDNKVGVSSGGDLTVNGVINTSKFESYVKNQFFVRGKIDASARIDVATGNMENNGLLLSKNIQIAAEQSLVNRFGGRIFADIVALTAKAGVIRNGSQYPFKPKDDYVTLLKPNDPQNIKLATINGIPFTDATKVNDLSAFILGKSVTLSANQNIENINPYFRHTTDSSAWDNGIAFEIAKANQVQLIAENTLELRSNSYVVNSSAIMGVNNPYGHFYIESPHIANERYNTQFIIEPFSDKTTAMDGAIVTTSGNEANLLVFSPPGVIYSFSKTGFYFSTSTGGFINNTSFFEIFNNADFINRSGNSNGTVTSIGLALEQEILNREQRYITSTRGCSSKPNVSGPGAASAWAAYTTYCGTWGSDSSTQVNQTEEQMYGTLFSVKGNINGKESVFYGTNHLTFDYMKRQIIQNQIDAYGVKKYTTTQTMTDYAPYSTTGSNLSRVVSFTEYLALSADGNYINLVRDGLVLSATGTVVNAASAAFKNTPQFSEHTQTTSVVDLVKQKIVEMKNALIKLLQDFQAWLTN
jgi:hypothetical protein